MNLNKVKNSALLLLASIIWGMAFVAQSVGMDYIGPFTLNGIRNIVGSIVLLPVIYVFSKKSKTTEKAPKQENSKSLIIGGLCCGLVLFLASNFQQIGIKYTAVGKAGFITTFYIILVPIFGLFLKKKCRALVWFSVLIAFIGLYLLCNFSFNGFSMNKGDLLVLIGAALFAVHILVIDYFAPRTDCIKLACIQFLVCGVLSLIVMLIFEKPTLSAIWAAKLPILYMGVMSSGVAFTLQIVAQKDLNPTLASLLMSMESVVSVIAGFLILKQSMSTRELLGCVFMFAAVIMAQLNRDEK